MLDSCNVAFVKHLEEEAHHYWHSCKKLLEVMLCACCLRSSLVLFLMCFSSCLSLVAKEVT